MASEDDSVKMFFADCMRCRNCEKIYLMKERKWKVRCSRNYELFNGKGIQPWVDNTGVALPDEEMKDKCRFYAERVVMNWSKEDKEND